MNLTVLILTYNANIYDLKKTLQSIITQSLKDFEIFICDDGSVENNEQFLVDYFDNVGFENYKLFLSPTNNGTISNMLNGLKEAKGRYVKPIAAGDYLCTEDALEIVYEKMASENLKCVFSNMRIFSIKNGVENIIDGFSIPFLKQDYINSGYLERMKENVIVFNDQLSGASIFYEREVLLEKLTAIQNRVKYMEDLIQYLLLLGNIEIGYINEKLVAYEIGLGISTSINSTNSNRMKKDKDSFLEYIFETYGNDRYVIRRKKIEKIENKYSNKAIKGILKTLNEPKWLYLRIRRDMTRKRLFKKSTN